MHTPVRAKTGQYYYVPGVMEKKQVLTKPCTVFPASSGLNDLPDLIIIRHRARFRPDKNVNSETRVFANKTCIAVAYPQHHIGNGRWQDPGGADGPGN